MNNRSSVNESNLVNFAAELPTLTQLDSKDGLLTFPFDHLYACHSEGAERRQTLTLDKEVEITTHCVLGGEEKEARLPDPAEVAKLRDRLNTFEQQNKALKSLIAYHLDLIQQQNEIVCKTEKLLNTVRQENETLKNRLSRADRRWPGNQHKISFSQLTPPSPPPVAQNIPPPPPPVSTATSTTVKTEPGAPQQQQIMLNNFTEIVMPDRSKQYLFNNDVKPQPYAQDQFGMPKVAPPDVAYLTDDLTVSKLLSSTINCESNFSTILDASDRPYNDNAKRPYNDPSMRSYNDPAKRTYSDPAKRTYSDPAKRSYARKETKTEKRPEPKLYTVTSNSGNPVIQRVQRNRRRTATGIGSMSRMPKPAPKVEPPPAPTPETSKEFEEDPAYEPFSVNKKSKMINTYGKPRCTNTPNTKKTSLFTGSLSDRLRLIDTTPTGEDPYLLGEAEMREQSPIPKLKLQKNNHSRMKLSSDTATDNDASMRFYESLIQSDPKEPTKIKLGKYNLTNTYVHPEELRDESPRTVSEEADPDVKADPEINWRTYNMSKPGNETSLCDFSYGETSNNLTSGLELPNLDTVEFQNLFTSDNALNLDNLSQELYSPAPEKTTAASKPNKRVVGTSSLSNSKKTSYTGAQNNNRIVLGHKPNRKRALSTTGLMKALKREASQKTPGTPKAKTVRAKAPAPAVSRAKKVPLPGMTTHTPYETQCGDPDLSWYLGLDPDVKVDDIDPPNDAKATTVEVPRWREKPYTACYSLEGTENLDDKVFEKRHQKYEAEERRQLRWHMRRIREQRHMERLRQRHRDAWCAGGSPAAAQPAVYTVWPQPQRDARFIQITDTLPVMAFGEIVPALPESEFMLPWVRSSKAQKRSKRSKTLY